MKKYGVWAIGMVVLLSVVLSVFSVKDCHFEKAKKKHLEKYGAHVWDDLQERLTRHTKLHHRLTTRQATTIVIPTVFHFLWHPSFTAEDKADPTARVMQELQYINSWFTNTNKYFEKRDQTLFAPAIQDTPIPIRFELATTDDAGNPNFPGFTTTEVSYETCSSPPGDTAYYTATDGRLQFNPNKFFNVWVCNLEGTTVGFAFFPTNPPDAKDGAVFTHKSLGDAESAGSTFVHEFVHYMGIDHTFGDGACDDADKIADTPPTTGDANSQFEGLCAGVPASDTDPTLKTVNEFVSCGNTVMVENLMDYNQEPCIRYMSKGQVERIMASFAMPPRNSFTGVQPLAQPQPLAATDTNTVCGFSINIPVNTQITGNTLDLPETTIGSNCDRFPDSPGLWFNFIGTGTVVTVSTCVPGFTMDTVLSVTKGTSCGNARCEAFSDDYEACPVNSLLSQVSICTEVGALYYIYIRGYYDTGAFALSVTNTPQTCTRITQTSCATAAPLIVGTPLVVNNIYTPPTSSFDNCGTGASQEGHEVFNPYWHSFTATSGSIHQISTCNSVTNFDTLLYVHGGTPCPTGVRCLETSDDDCTLNPQASSLFFCAIAGRTYYPVVAGYLQAEGTYQISITDTLQPCCQPTTPCPLTAACGFDSCGNQCGQGCLFGQTCDTANFKCIPVTPSFTPSASVTAPVSVSGTASLTAPVTMSGTGSITPPVTMSGTGSITSGITPTPSTTVAASVTPTTSINSLPSATPSGSLTPPITQSGTSSLTAPISFSGTSSFTSPPSISSAPSNSRRTGGTNVCVECESATKCGRVTRFQTVCEKTFDGSYSKVAFNSSVCCSNMINVRTFSFSYSSNLGPCKTEGTNSRLMNAFCDALRGTTTCINTATGSTETCSR